MLAVGAHIKKNARREHALPCEEVASGHDPLKCHQQQLAQMKHNQEQRASRPLLT